MESQDYLLQVGQTLIDVVCFLLYLLILGALVNALTACQIYQVKFRVKPSARLQIATLQRKNKDPIGKLGKQIKSS